MTIIVIAEKQFTRPNDTTTYASGDLVANNATAASVIPIAFDLGKVVYNNCFIRRARLFSSSTNVTNAAYRLHLYTKKPTVTNGDNGAFAAVRAGYIGALDVTIDQVFSDGSCGFALPAQGSELSFISEGNILYGLLEAKVARTPVALETFTVVLETHRY